MKFSFNMSTYVCSYCKKSYIRKTAFNNHQLKCDLIRICNNVKSKGEEDEEELPVKFNGSINDMYKLFYLNKDKLEFFDNAYIPSYEKSVIMNNLFRKIKENGKLDRLEESDDEEEFQDCSIDKFVDLNKTVNMICKYHSKFKKWIPISTTDEQPIQKENFAIT